MLSFERNDKNSLKNIITSESPKLYTTCILLFFVIEGPIQELDGYRYFRILTDLLVQQDQPQQMFRFLMESETLPFFKLNILNLKKNHLLKFFLFTCGFRNSDLDSVSSTRAVRTFPSRTATCSALLPASSTAEKSIPLLSSTLTISGRSDSAAKWRAV